VSTNVVAHVGRCTDDLRAVDVSVVSFYAFIPHYLFVLTYSTPSCPTITTFNPLLNRCHWLLRLTRVTCAHTFNNSDNVNAQMINHLIGRHISDDDIEETVEVCHFV
jgi:hypothetical protein